MERALSVAVIVAAVALTVSVVYNLVSESSGQPDRLAPQFEPEWGRALEVAIPVAGAPEAHVSIVEFVDFQCPVCARSDSILDIIQRELPNEVARFVVHFPLPQHRFATQAAFAAECGRHVGRFEQVSRAIFENQEFLGLKSWGAIASEAGVRDTVQFLECMLDDGLMEQVEAGLDIGEAFGVRGTPTLLVNGWRVNAMLTAEQLRRLVHGVLAEEVSPQSSPRAVRKIIGDRSGDP